MRQVPPAADEAHWRHVYRALHQGLRGQQQQLRFRGVFTDGGTDGATKQERLNFWVDNLFAPTAYEAYWRAPCPVCPAAAQPRVPAPARTPRAHPAMPAPRVMRSRGRPPRCGPALTTALPALKPALAGGHGSTLLARLRWPTALAWPASCALPALCLRRRRLFRGRVCSSERGHNVTCVALLEPGEAVLDARIQAQRSFIVRRTALATSLVFGGLAANGALPFRSVAPAAAGRRSIPVSERGLRCREVLKCLQTAAAPDALVCARAARSSHGGRAAQRCDGGCRACHLPPSL